VHAFHDLFPSISFVGQADHRERLDDLFRNRDCAQPFVDSFSDFVADAPEFIECFFGGSLECRGIIKRPVVALAQTWKDPRAILVGAAADDDQVPDGHATEKLLQPLRVLGGNIDANFVHHLSCDWMDFRFRLRPGTEDVEPIAGKLIQEPFSHLAPAGIPRA